MCFEALIINLFFKFSLLLVFFALFYWFIHPKDGIKSVVDMPVIANGLFSMDFPSNLLKNKRISRFEGKKSWLQWVKVSQGYRRLETRVWPYEMSRIWGQMIYTFMKDRESLMILEEVCVAIHCFLFYLNQIPLVWDVWFWLDSKDIGRTVNSFAACNSWDGHYY